MDTFDQLRIDTPEQVALELPIAGVGSRFLAIAVDTLVQAVAGILAIVLLSVALPALLRYFPATVAIGPVLGPALLVLFFFCLYWGYFAFFEILWSGQTPGKRLAQIRVIKDSGSPIDPTAALIRNLLRAIDLLPAIYAAGVVCMIFDRNSRRIGDLVAGTVVVHDHAAEGIATAWSPAAPAATATAPFSVNVSLNPDEILLIETFLERRFSLDTGVRRATATRIAGVIQARAQLPPVSGQDVEDYLESIARQARDAGRMRRV